MPSSLQPAGVNTCELIPALMPQPLLAFAVIVPDAVVPQVTSILLGPCKLVIVPFEEVHVKYGTGPVSGFATLKLSDAPEQNAPGGFCVIVPGLSGLPQIVLLVLGALVAGAHATELAATVKNPLVKEDDTFNRIVDPVADPEIVVPEGTVQV